MSRRGQKRRNPAGGRGLGKAQPGKLRADPTLAALLSQAIELPDQHCLLVQDAAGRVGLQLSAEMVGLCQQAGALAQQISPADPGAALRAALMSLMPPAGGVH